jgi:cell division initiation protein
MRLTPVEIENMVFTRKKFGGLDESSVRDFLSRVAREQEELVRDYKRVREELHTIREQAKEGASLESALKDALVTAQKTTGQIRQHAQKESQLLLKESEMKAETLLDDARMELKGLTDEIRNYKNLKRKLKTDMKMLLQSYMDLLVPDAR